MLKLRQMIPPLTARTTAGVAVRAWDFKQKKSLVIAFLHADCRRCVHLAEQLCAHAAALAERDAVALVIFSEPPPVAWRDAPPQVVVASDMSGQAQRAFLGQDAFGPRGQERVGVFVADQYGELFAQWSGGDEALPGVPEALSWLAQIQIACEECGAPHWSLD
jgi:peroxiredoxin